MEAHFWRPLVYVTSFSPRGDFPGTFLFVLFFVLFSGRTIQHVGLYFLAQGSNPHPLHWKASILG